MLSSKFMEADQYFIVNTTDCPDERHVTEMRAKPGRGHPVHYIFDCGEYRPSFTHTCNERQAAALASQLQCQYRLATDSREDQQLVKLLDTYRQVRHLVAIS